MTKRKLKAPPDIPATSSETIAKNKASNKRDGEDDVAAAVVTSEDDQKLAAQSSSSYDDDSSEDDAVKIVMVKPPPVRPARASKKIQLSSDEYLAKTLQQTYDREAKEVGKHAIAGDIIDLTDPSEHKQAYAPDRRDSGLVVAQGLTTSFTVQDSALARKLTAQFKKEHEEAENFTVRDSALARKLTARFKKEAEEVEKKESIHKARMLKTSTGKAWTFVEEILAIYARLSQTEPFKGHPAFIKPVATDDIVELSERLITTQEEFRKAGKPFKISIGFHYTKDDNLSSIRTDGLLTKKERDHRSIPAAFNGSAYGDGVYTSSGPRETWNQRYGSVGLLVAQLHGNAKVLKARPPGVMEDDPQFDSIVHQWLAVLRNSSQCVPLMQYDGNQLKFDGPSCLSMTILMPVQKQVQQLIDKLLNSDV